MSEFVYIVGYDPDERVTTATDFLGVWLQFEEVIAFFYDDPRCTYEFVKECWVARLESGVPESFTSLHDNPDILAIQEEKRLAEGIDPEPAR